MKKFIIAIMCLSAVLAGCSKGDVTETADASTFATVTETEVVTTAEETVTTTDEVVTTEDTTPLITGEQPTEFSIDNAISVEDYWNGDVLYKADFDGDGEKENCVVKILGHGTQCYVEDIEITKANGEKIVVEHPTTATGTRTSFYKTKDNYELYLECDTDNDTVIIYPFDTLSTAKENLVNPIFGDIFDYSVIGDRLYFRGSVACGFSEVLGDVIYEYEYRNGALRVSHIWYRDYINDMDYDAGRSTRGSIILVDPSTQEKGDITLPESEPLVEARAIMGNPTFLVYEKGLTYYVKQYTSALSDEYTLKKYTLSLPAGYTDGVIISDGPGGGSGELGFLVSAKKDDRDVALWYLFYADRLAAPVEVWENDYLSFTPDENTRLHEVYAYSPYCIARTYVSTEDERWLYYIIDLGGGQRIRYDKLEDAHPPMANNLVTFADVNFDGIDDLCLKLGNFGAQGFVMVRAYLGIGYDKYTLCESFENISNPALDAENKQILGTNRRSAAERYFTKYEFKNGEFVKVEELLYNADTETVEINGEVLPSAEFETADGLWNIPYTKWSDIIGE